MDWKRVFRRVATLFSILIPILIGSQLVSTPANGEEPVTPYDLYLFNFGDCVASCVGNGERRRVCEYNCWQIWKFFLQPRYRLVNGVLVDTHRDHNTTSPSPSRQ